MKKVLAFDIDQTLNIAKTPLTEKTAGILKDCLDHFEICPISGQKFEQFLIQIVDPLVAAGATAEQLKHLHLFVTQGTQYRRYIGEGEYDPEKWEIVYNNPAKPEQIKKIIEALEQAAKETGYWEEDKLQPGDEIIEDRVTQVTFSALGQKAGTEEKYAWDPDMKKRDKIAARARELAPEFEYEVAGTTSINAIIPGMNKVFGMTHLLEELDVEMKDVLYFGDMTQPGGNDYPVVEMGFETITVRSHEDTEYALMGILGIL